MAHVLICDDSPSIRELLTAVFQSAGHAVATAESAEMAIPMVSYVDACIVDGLGGECWRVLEAAEAEGKHAVLYSADGDRCREAARRGYPSLEKPAGIAEIVAAVCGVGAAA
jgi:DNA-binding NtrC family response regulator